MRSDKVRSALGWSSCLRAALPRSPQWRSRTRMRAWSGHCSGERYREPLPMAAQKLSAGHRANEVGEGKEELIHKAG